MSRNRLTFSNVTATTALLLAAAGGGSAAYAAGLADNSVGSAQIKNGSVKLVDINAKAKAKFTAGPKTFHDSLNFHNVSNVENDHNILEMELPAGNYQVTATGTFHNTMGAIETRDFRCDLTQPIGNEFTETITETEARVDGGYKEGWAMTGVVSNDNPITLTLSCEGSGGEAWTGKILDPRLVAVKVGPTTAK